MNEENKNNSGPISLASDLFKKALTVGAGAAILTEEALKTLVQDLKLPKEVISTLITSAQQSKNEFIHRLSQDLIQKLQERTDLKEMISEIMRKNEFEITIKIKTKEKSESNKED